ncbi:hypothetical protein MLD38_037363 [Melastoma candidum]|uniref:Uncharacterized protein n=1 Tax=Melastoma candidum TaxID=119954 RepID=A0ACB9LLU7_9MYRT|nr:hypothetical protein MLD38_037363 [Melastoma candidum]
MVLMRFGMPTWQLSRGEKSEGPCKVIKDVLDRQHGGNHESSALRDSNMAGCWRIALYSEPGCYCRKDLRRNLRSCLRLTLQRGIHHGLNCWLRDWLGLLQLHGHQTSCLLPHEACVSCAIVPDCTGL